MAKQAIDSQHAEAMLAEMRINVLINEEETPRLRKSLDDAELALANADARRLQDVETAY